MRRLRLLQPLTRPDRIIPAGEEITVDAAEARTLRCALGLVEDLGEVAGESSQSASGGTASPPAGADTAGGAGGAAGTDAQSEGAAGSNPRPDGDGQPGEGAGPGAAASNTAAPVTADAAPGKAARGGRRKAA